MYFLYKKISVLIIIIFFYIYPNNQLKNINVSPPYGQEPPSAVPVFMYSVRKTSIISRNRNKKKIKSIFIYISVPLTPFINTVLLFHDAFTWKSFCFAFIVCCTNHTIVFRAAISIASICFLLGIAQVNSCQYDCYFNRKMKPFKNY